MDLEILTLCEHALAANGQLSINGAFVEKIAQTFPVKTPPLYIAIQLRFAPKENGKHNIEVRLIDGNTNKPLHEMGISLEFNIPKNYLTGIVPIALKIEPLILPKPGRVILELKIDGREIGSTPFYLYHRINTPKGN